MRVSLGMFLASLLIIGALFAFGGIGGLTIGIIIAFVLLHPPF